MTKRLHTLLGRVVRDIERKTTQRDGELTALLQRAQRLLTQQRQDREKLDSVQAPYYSWGAYGKVFETPSTKTDSNSPMQEHIRRWEDFSDLR